jgi:hypothetical protein
MRRDLRNSHHLATISHDGRFWDAYLELVEDPGAGRPARGRIAFSAADSGDTEPVRTAVIFVEDTPQEVVARAREFKTHQLVALLRSAELAEPPDQDPESGASSHPPSGSRDVSHDDNPGQGEAAP